MKNNRWIMMKLLITTIITFSLINASNDINQRIKTDISFIIPGHGAEKVLLNDKANELIGLKGYPDKVSEFKDKMELFKDVFKIESPVKITFDKIYYFNYHKAIIFLDSNKVSAIAGLNNERITPDSVNLSKGIEYFIFSYGNKNLKILKKKNDNLDRIYLYSEYGIAIVDDRGDDKIDMYLIFPAVAD